MLSQSSFRFYGVMSCGDVRYFAFATRNYKEIPAGTGRRIFIVEGRLLL